MEGQIGFWAGTTGATAVWRFRAVESVLNNLNIYEIVSEAADFEESAVSAFGVEVLSLGFTPE